MRRRSGKSTAARRKTSVPLRLRRLGALSEGYDGDPCPHLLVAMEPDRRHPLKARAVRAPGSAGLTG
jgi:hypothetical protein